MSLYIMNNIIYPISVKFGGRTVLPSEYHAWVVVLTTVLAATVQKQGTQFELLGCVNVFNQMDHG